MHIFRQWFYNKNSNIGQNVLKKFLMLIKKILNSNERNKELKEQDKFKNKENIISKAFEMINNFKKN